ncbi:MAG: ATP-binding cassette domain-containing protein, partial [Rhizobiales bacterium]|nr:ATP-binding cassette domain-containing protein [Hyphomicrobiales bacterium]
MKINLLKVTNLSAQKGDRLLFEDIGFELKSGEALLLKGPNGSGKTTMLQLLAGADHIRTGKIRIFMGNAKTPRADGVIGVSHFISHQDALKKNLTVIENLTFWTEYLSGDVSHIKNALQTVGL